VLYGPDSKTKITNETKNCLFMCYSFGLNEEELRNHLNDLAEYLKIFIKDNITINEIKII
jgi:hypothetical protein